MRALPCEVIPLLGIKQEGEKERLEIRRVTGVGTLGRASVPVKTLTPFCFDTTDALPLDTSVHPYGLLVSL